MWLAASPGDEVTLSWRAPGASRVWMPFLMTPARGDTTPPSWSGEHAWGTGPCGEDALELVADEVTDTWFRVQQSGATWTRVVGPTAVSVEGEPLVVHTPQVSLNTMWTCPDQTPLASWSFEVTAFDGSGNVGAARHVPALEPEETAPSEVQPSRGCKVAPVTGLAVLRAVARR